MKYEVLRNLKHNLVTYSKGEEAEMPHSQGKPLVEAGILKLIPPPKNTSKKSAASKE